MNDYVNYKPEDFAQDEYFIRWVKTTNIHIEAFWQNWLETYPFKRKDIETARQLVLVVHQTLHPFIDSDEISDLRAAILEKIREIEDEPKPRIWRPNWLVAASIGLLIMLGGYWLFTNASGKTETVASKPLHTIRLVKVENMADDIKAVFLPDGSSVTLKKGSKITFPAQFEAHTRKITLEGEAFFEITKDKDRPFFVMAKDVVTKVLGTSFNVRAYSVDKEVSVLVKTGRVSVFRSNPAELSAQLTDKTLHGLVLSPNQRAVFITEDNSEEAFKEDIKPLPAPAPTVPRKKDIEEMTFDYREENVGNIFEQLETAYNIEIEYEKQNFDSCPVTASLTGEPLFIKLDLICKAIGAEYQMMEEKVIIKGQGCN